MRQFGSDRRWVAGFEGKALWKLLRRGRRKMADGDNVSPEHQKLMDDIIYLRGRIITSYAQVEFLLADVATKLELKFP